MVAVVISTVAQAVQKKAAPAADDSFFGSYGVTLGVIAIAAIGVAAIVFLRKRNSSGTDLAKITDSSGLKPGEFRMTYKEKKKMRPIRVRETEVPEAVPEIAVNITPILPVYSFVRLERSSPFKSLPDSQDEALLDAIDQTQEESEEDAEVRGLALKVLAAFKTGNSISAISQMALYDLSSKLRSNAVAVLAELDHESVLDRKSVV